MNIEPITVTQLNRYMKDKIEMDEFLNNVYVKGEISNFKHHYTGHFYFTLKDENSLIKCVMFKSYAQSVRFEPEDGMKVCIFGTVSVYEKDGVYQIYAKSIKQDGIGDLYQRFEELKNKLAKEGLFDDFHKKRIPFMPKTIGVLTSNTGAVIRDIINVSTRRNPKVHIRLLPVPVQGDGASKEIAKAIQIMNEKELCDVMIIGRGGGSLEDLWPFNEEIVARAIYNSRIPIISAVGHETDFTIADFVADLRAPTPSAAAELAVTDIEELKDRISIYNKRLKMALSKKNQIMRLRYEKCINSRIFKSPQSMIEDRYLLVDKNLKSMELSINKIIKDAKLYAMEWMTKLDTLSPLKTLTRGFCVVEKDGVPITKSIQLKKDMEIDLRFQDGTKKAIIE